MSNSRYIVLLYATLLLVLLRIRYSTFIFCQVGIQYTILCYYGFFFLCLIVILCYRSTVNRSCLLHISLPAC